MIETGLRTLLLAQSSITTLAPSQTVGGVSFSGIFLDSPAEAFSPPFVVISNVGCDPLVASEGTTGLQKSEFDIDCYSTDSVKAKTLANTVASFLADYTGAAGGSDTINAVIWNNQNDSKIWTQDGRDVRYYIRSLNFTIFHS